MCVDIDECDNSTIHNCSEVHNEICRNVDGSFECDCMSGFDRHENVCEGEVMFGCDCEPSL